MHKQETKPKSKKLSATKITFEIRIFGYNDKVLGKGDVTPEAEEERKAEEDRIRAEEAAKESAYASC